MLGKKRENDIPSQDMYINSGYLFGSRVPFKEKKIEVTIKSEFNKDWRTLTVYATFIVTILLWMTEKWHGVNSYVVALIPIIAFTTTGVMKAPDIKTMNWDVIWLIAGGIALGDALSKTGLAEVLAHIVDYSKLNIFMIIVSVCTIGWLISNFISNTATANLMIPIIFAVLSTISATNPETLGAPSQYHLLLWPPLWLCPSP